MLMIWKVTLEESQCEHHTKLEDLGKAFNFCVVFTPRFLNSKLLYDGDNRDDGDDGGNDDDNDDGDGDGNGHGDGDDKAPDGYCPKSSVTRPKISVTRPEINVTRPEINVTCPKISMTRPDH